MQAFSIRDLRERSGDISRAAELEEVLDAGEIQALALAQKLNCGVLMDELRGRKVAKRNGIQTVKQIFSILMQNFVLNQFGAVVFTK